MTQRFLTHFGTVSLLHLSLLLMGALFFEGEAMKKSLGLKVVSFKVAAGVYLGGGESPAKPTAPKKVKPVPKKIANAPSVHPLKKEEVFPMQAEETQETGSTGTGFGKPGSNPGNGTGSAFGNALADLKTIYKAELKNLIDSKTTYPAVARRLGQTGVVTVAFKLLQDGTITNVRIENSSGNTRLDGAALEAVKKVGKYKAIPSELNSKTMDLTVPINFQLI